MNLANRLLCNSKPISEIFCIQKATHISADGINVSQCKLRRPNIH